MKKQNYIIVSALLASLFVYTFYRTEHTVVNRLFAWLISSDNFHSVRIAVRSILPLNEFVIYSLPEGLWIYCITLLSRQYCTRIKGWQLDCALIPLVYAVALELMQLLHIIRGRFDFMDVWVSSVSWLLAIYSFREPTPAHKLSTHGARKKIVCALTYGIVYLSHVTS